MTKPKPDNIDNDLMEVECALRLAHEGGNVIWESAQEALERLFKACAKNLPANYTPRI